MILRLMGLSLIFVSSLNFSLKALILDMLLIRCVKVHDSFKVDAEQLFSPLGVPVGCNYHYHGGFICEPTG